MSLVVSQEKLEAELHPLYKRHLNAFLTMREPPVDGD